MFVVFVVGNIINQTGLNGCDDLKGLLLYYEFSIYCWGRGELKFGIEKWSNAWYKSSNDAKFPIIKNPSQTIEK